MFALALLLYLQPFSAHAQDTAGDDDGDGSLNADDCEPRDDRVHPDSIEYNDGLDNDCDGSQPPLYGCGETSYEGLFLLPVLLFGRRRRR